MKHIQIDAMYRDGSNFKNCYTIVLENDSDLPTEQVVDILNDFFSENDSIIPSYYGLPSFAPLSNEFLPTYNELDHSFIEFDNAQPTSKNSYSDCDAEDYSIANILNHIQNPDLVKAARAEAKREAIEMLEQQIELIKTTV